MLLFTQFLKRHKRTMIRIAIEIQRCFNLLICYSRAYKRLYRVWIECFNPLNKLQQMTFPFRKSGLTSFNPLNKLQQVDLKTAT